MDLLPDSLLNNRYQIKQKLGQGGMGAVYLAVDTALDTAVAVKVNRNPNEHGTSQFLREARLLASLRHPNLPRVTDYFILDQAQFLVMDYIPGKDLETVFKEVGRPPLAQVLDWANQIGNALSYLHHQEQPIVHRDVKPANVRLSNEGQAILVDFGIAKELNSGQTTTSGTSGYTPGYAPPEQYGGNVRTGPYTDQYALAALVYHLLTGQKPADSIQRALGSAKLAPVSEFNPAVPNHIQAALQRALALKVDARFRDMDDFLRALNAPLSSEAAAQMAQGPVVLFNQDSAPRQQPEQATMPSAARGRTGETAPPVLQTPQIQAQRQHRAINGWIIGGALALVMLLAVGGAALLLLSRLISPVSRTTQAAIPVATKVEAKTAAVTLASPPASSSPPQPVAPSPVPTKAIAPTQPPPAATSTPQPTKALEPSATAAPPTAAPTRSVLGGGDGRIAFVSDRADGKTLQIWTMRASLNNQGKVVTYDLQQLTNSPGNKRQPAWSPDGKHLVYVSAGLKGGGDNLWLMNADGSGAPVEVTNLPGNESEPAWSPDGRWIAFTYDGREDGTLQLYMVQPDGNGLYKLSYDQAESGPSWTADRHLSFIMNASGQRIVYIRGQTDPRTGAQPTQEYYVTPVRFDMQAMHFTDNMGQAGRVSWSPDGKLAAYTRIDFSRTSVVILRNPIKIPAQDIIKPTSSGKDRDPDWSSDSQWILFASERDGNPEIYVMRATGQLQTNLTTDMARDLDPAWLVLR